MILVKKNKKKHALRFINLNLFSSSSIEPIAERNFSTSARKRSLSIFDASSSIRSFSTSSSNLLKLNFFHNFSTLMEKFYFSFLNFQTKILERIKIILNF